MLLKVGDVKETSGRWDSNRNSGWGAQDAGLASNPDSPGAAEASRTWSRAPRPENRKRWRGALAWLSPAGLLLKGSRHRRKPPASGAPPPEDVVPVLLHVGHLPEGDVQDLAHPVSILTVSVGSADAVLVQGVPVPHEHPCHLVTCGEERRRGGNIDLERKRQRLPHSPVPLCTGAWQCLPPPRGLRRSDHILMQTAADGPAEAPTLTFCYHTLGKGLHHHNTLWG